MRTRATERIIEAIDPVLRGQFECERLNTETKGFSLGEPTSLPTPLPATGLYPRRACVFPLPPLFFSSNMNNGAGLCLARGERLNNWH